MDSYNTPIKFYLERTLPGAHLVDYAQGPLISSSSIPSGVCYS